MSIGSQIGSVYNGVVVGVGEHIASALRGTQVHFDPMGLALTSALEALGIAYQYVTGLLSDALDILESGLFLESDETGRAFDISEDDAFQWASSGMHAGEPSSSAAPSGSGTAYDAGKSVANAIAALTRAGGSRAKYPLMLIARSGKRKIYTASYKMLEKYNNLKGIPGSVYQRNHLSQASLFEHVNIVGNPNAGIPNGQGLAVNLKGSVADRLEHYKFHKYLDDYMEQLGRPPSVHEYNDAMEVALTGAGFTGKEARLLRKAAEKQQTAYGIIDTDKFVAIPQRNT
jgi:hypothetical protein